MSNKETGPSILQLSPASKDELESRFFPQSLQVWTQPTDASITASWDPEQGASLAEPGRASDP